MIPGIDSALVLVWALSGLGIYYLGTLVLGTVRRRQYRASNLRDPANQMRAVASAEFTARKVMNLSEFRVFQIAEEEARTTRGARVFAQTSMGEFLSSNDNGAFSSVNSKRVDVLIVGSDGMPLVAIEYQGSGHYQDTAAMRDAVKREALRKAGIGFVEVFEGDDRDETRRRIRMALGRPAPPPVPNGEPPAAFGRRKVELPT